MIFYLQTQHGLPSLHQLYRPQTAPVRDTYAFDFAVSGDATALQNETVGRVAILLHVGYVELEHDILRLEAPLFCWHDLLELNGRLLYHWKLVGLLL